MQLAFLAATAFSLPACSREEGSLPGAGDDAPAVLFGELGLQPGQFSYPRGMDAAGDEQSPSLLIIDKAARLQRLDARTGRVLGAVRTPEWALGKPTGLTVGPNPLDPAREAVWVADTHYHRVLVYDIGRQLSDAVAEPVPTPPVLSFGRYGTDPGGMVYPTDIAIETDDAGLIRRVFVSEYGGNDRVTAFDPRTDADGSVRFEPVRTFGSFGVAGDEAPGEVVFNRPQALAWDAARGELLVADACNHRVGRFTRDGDPLGWIGSPRTAGPAPGSFLYPYALALLDDGTVLVNEFGNARVQRIDPRIGDSLGSWGGPGRGEPGRLAQPWSVVALGRTAFILDSGNNRVQAFRLPAGVGAAARPAPTSSAVARGAP